MALLRTDPKSLEMLRLLHLQKTLHRLSQTAGGQAFRPARHLCDPLGTSSNSVYVQKFRSGESLPSERERTSPPRAKPYTLSYFVTAELAGRKLLQVDGLLRGANGVLRLPGHFSGFETQSFDRFLGRVDLPLPDRIPDVSDRVANPAVHRCCRILHKAPPGRPCRTHD